MQKPTPKTECAIRVVDKIMAIFITPHTNDAREFINNECGVFGELTMDNRGKFTLFVDDGYDCHEVAEWIRSNFDTEDSV